MELLREIRGELKKHVELPYKEGAYRYFKEEIELYGVRTTITRKIAADYYRQVKCLPRGKILSLAETLLRSGFMEEKTIAFAWLRKLKKEKDDFKIFESFLNKYCTAWSDVDDFCTHAFGELVAKFPELIPKVKAWTKSKNRWMRRGSAVIFIHSDLTKRYLKDIFEVADILLMDKEDLVQKGYGWMLKEASNFCQKEVFEFVIARKDRMPRTALRYAIEKMPDSMRRRAMEKD